MTTPRAGNSPAGPPDWLRARLLAALDQLGRPASPDAAIAAIAARHRRSPDEVLLVSGAAEALALLARVLPAGLAACAGSDTGDAEKILRAAGHNVQLVTPNAQPGLDADAVPDDADLVIVASPAEPGTRHAALAPERLARPGRILVIDETRDDAPPGNAAQQDVPGLVVLRGLASGWGLDGLGAGYLLGEPTLVAALRQAQPALPVSALALVALEACSQPEAVAWSSAQSAQAAQDNALRPRTQKPAPASKPAGSVVLIGAGPGGSDLITMRGWRALHDADVVVADRLADPALTRQLRPGVLLVNAGKAPGAQQLSQEQINQVLIEHARAGRRVARLKGGDPFVFGRGGEEAAACAAAGIACTVIPGLSSALAGPALAGIPLTHREIGQSFTVVSGHLPPDHPDSRVDWKALAAGSDTLVLLMAVRNLRAIAAHLTGCGTPPETPAALVQDAGTPGQRVFRGTLGGLADPDSELPVRNPAVIIIGPTAGDLLSA